MVLPHCHTDGRERERLSRRHESLRLPYNSLRERTTALEYRLGRNRRENAILSLRPLRQFSVCLHGRIREAYRSLLYLLSVPRGDTEIPQRVRLATQAYPYYSALLGGLAYVYAYHDCLYLHSLLALPARLVLNTRRPNVGYHSY